MLLNDTREKVPLWQDILTFAACVAVGLGVANILHRWRELDRDQRDPGLLVLAVVLPEALAASVPRYDACVIWLIPMSAVLLWYREKYG